MTATIRDRGYQKYDGPRTPSSTRWLVVARRLVRSSLKRRGVIALVVLSLFPAFFSAVALYLRSRMSAGGSLDEHAYTLLVKPYGTFLIALFMAMTVGGGAIADDARAGAFQLYFARPLTPAQYLAGKLAAVAALVASVSLGPTLLVALFRLSLGGGGVGAAVSVAALGALESVALAATVLAASSLTRRRGLAQGGFAALVLLPWLLGGKLCEYTRTPWPALPSLPTHLDALARWLFAIPNDLGDRAMPPLIALAVVAAYVAGALWLARRRLADVEIIAS